MSNKLLRLVWLDLEMTGLDLETDRILEIATIVTDQQLNIIAQGPNLVIQQDKSVLSNMNAWCIKQHGESGLTEKSLRSEITVGQAEQLTLNFLKSHVNKNQTPMCGNSICTDRRFLAKYMPTLESFFHYRNVDVSSIKELLRRWYSPIENFQKQNNHLALQDIEESIKELRYYRENFFINQ